MELVFFTTRFFCIWRSLTATMLPVPLGTHHMAGISRQDCLFFICLLPIVIIDVIFLINYLAKKYSLPKLSPEFFVDDSQIDSSILFENSELFDYTQNQQVASTEN